MLVVVGIVAMDLFVGHAGQLLQVGKDLSLVLGDIIARQKLLQLLRELDGVAKRFSNVLLSIKAGPFQITGVDCDEWFDCVGCHGLRVAIGDQIKAGSSGAIILSR